MRSADQRPERDLEGSGQVVALVASWVVVGVPAVWGVWQVVLKSLALFGR
jgi:hypothetical protein